METLVRSLDGTFRGWGAGIPMFELSKDIIRGVLSHQKEIDGQAAKLIAKPKRG